MRVALFQPCIAGNVGAVLRIGACFDTQIDLIEPMGFAWDDKRVARAGMDYIDHVRIARHRDWDAFLATVSSRIVLFTTKGAGRFDAAALGRFYSWERATDQFERAVEMALRAGEAPLSSAA